MTSVRNDTLGIKQTLRIEWLEAALRLVLSGMSSQMIRSELRDRLSQGQMAPLGASRGTTARDQIVSMIMAIWVTPAAETRQLRETCLELCQTHGEKSKPLHWVMTMSAYPFWFFVATIVGRALGLQSHVRQAQIVVRAKEHYGDRESVSRYARATIRSMVGWRAIVDTGTPGRYSLGPVQDIHDERLTAALVEGVLIASGRDRILVDDALASPALFPFQLPWISSSRLSESHPRISSTQHALDSSYVSLIDGG